MGGAMPGYENYGLEANNLVDPHYIPSFAELSEEYPDESSPLLDQKTTKIGGITEDQQFWRDHGYLIKKQFVHHDLIDEYIEARRKLNIGPGLFPDCHPHLYLSVIRDMCCSRDLHYLLVDLLGEEMGLHFSLNGFKSSERGWHQDDYLNPESTMARYVAVWMAMGDIHPDSGPFEFIADSHKWPCLRREKVRAFIKPEIRYHENNEWIISSEYFVNKAIETHLIETGAKVLQFNAKKGDILIWHAKLMHRGTIPNNPNLLRPALISHYSNVRDRRDIGNEITRHGDGGYFWEFSSMGEVLSPDKVSRTDVGIEPKASARGESCNLSHIRSKWRWMRSKTRTL
jgi:hypothetical protein